jgi:hypothetical protein
MTIQHTIDIPGNRRLTIEIPPEIPAGRVILAFTPAAAEDEAFPEKSRGQSRDEAFRGALRRAYGAWADRPWENAAGDINALRNEWEHRDPWHSDPSKRRRD